jgi:hypothetical protein
VNPCGINTLAFYSPDDEKKFKQLGALSDRGSLWKKDIKAKT